MHTGWLGGAQEQLPAIQQAKLLLSIDYGEGQNAGFLEATRSLADVAFFSLPRGTEEQARRRAEEISRGGVEVVVVTRGGEGSLAFYKGNFYSQPAYPVQVVDSLGAGDAFIGAFLAGWLMGLSAQECLEQRLARGCFRLHALWRLVTGLKWVKKIKKPLDILPPITKLIGEGHVSF